MTVLFAPTAGAAVPAYRSTFTMQAIPPDPQPGPIDVAVAADNTLYATGSWGGGFPGSVVQRFTSNTTAVTLDQGSSHPQAGDTFYFGLTLDPSKVVYAGNSRSTPPGITRIVEGGAITPNWADGSYFRPTDIVRSPSDGRFYILDENNKEVTIVEADGDVIDTFNGSGTGEGPFHAPGALAIDGEGNIYVGDFTSSNSGFVVDPYVKKYDHEGVFVSKFTLAQFGDRRFGGMAFGPDGNLYVGINDKVVITQANGAFVDEFGGAGTAPGNTSGPGGITINLAGDVYVASSGGVQCFSYGSGCPGAGGPGPGPGTGGPPDIRGVVRYQQGGQTLPAAGVPVEACLVDGRGCRLATTGSDGRYEVLGAVAGVWSVRARPSEALPVNGDSAPFQLTVGSSDIENADILLPPLLKMPAGVSFQGETGPIVINGVPAVRWDDPIKMSVRSCPLGRVFVEILRTGGGRLRYFELDPVPPIGPDGQVEYVGSTSALQPSHGRVTVQIFKECDKLPPVKEPVPFNAYIDPSGNVYTLKGAPVVGATVTLMREDALSVFNAVPNGSILMSPSNRTNPDRTRVDGSFAWDVLAGRYKLRVQRKGCFKPKNKKVKFIETPVYDIPPPVVGLDLRMDCPDKKKPKITKIKVKRRVLSFKVSEAAKIKALLERCKPGKKKCKRAKAFKKRARFGQVLEFKVPKKVKKGRYRVTVTATDFAKNRAKPAVRKVSVK